MPLRTCKAKAISPLRSWRGCNKAVQWHTFVFRAFWAPVILVTIKTKMYILCSPGVVTEQPRQRLPQPSSSKALEKLLDPYFRWNPKLVPLLLKELKAQKRQGVAGEVVAILHSYKTKLGLPDYTAGISACARAKKWQLALHLFGGMPKGKVDPNVISYNAIISSCEKGQQWQLALHLFCGMPKAKVDPNVICYNASIRCFEKGQQWQLALHLFGSMSTAKLHPDVISYNASVSSCEKGQQWQLALH